MTLLYRLIWWAAEKWDAHIEIIGHPEDVEPW